MLQKREDAEDSPQTSCFRLSATSTVEGKSHYFQTWLVRVAINAVAVYAVGPDSPGDLYPGRQH
jgi:hypothetical protein